MKEISNNKFAQLFWYEEDKIIEHKWKPVTEDMEDEDYKREMLNYVKLSYEYTPRLILANTSEFDYTITPEIQDWVTENIHKHNVKLGIEKIAFVLPEEIFAQVSVSQTGDEAETVQKGAPVFFDNYDEAMAYLKA